MGQGSSAAAAAGEDGDTKAAHDSSSGGAGAFGLPDSLDDVFAELSLTSFPSETNVAEGSNGGADEDAAAAAADSGGLPPRPGSSSGGRQPPLLSTSSFKQQQQPGGGSWLVINDFSIAAIQPQEVLELYDGQKMPLLLFYTQVGE
jgi:hypothetical protein